MRKHRERQEGMALVFVMLAAISIAGAVSFVVHQVYTVKRNTDFTVNRTLLDEAVKAGIDIGVDRLWHQYKVTNGNTTGNLASYRVFIENLVPNNEDTNNNGYRDSNEPDLNGDGNFDVASPYIFIGTGGAQEARTLASGALLTSVTFARTDDLTGCDVTIRVTAEFAGERRAGVQTVRISGAPFTGFEFAVLANNINCILCHAEVRNLDLERNTDTSMHGSFDRLKVAALQSLLVRPSEADSNVAGTVYTRGQVYNQSGSPLSGLENTTFKGYKFSDEDGKILQDDSGGMTKVSLTKAGTTDGDLDQFSNFYMNYPTDPELMTDGDLPVDFPAPFPDDDGDRDISMDEFEPVMLSTNGTISGGVLYGIPNDASGFPTGVFSGNGLPSSGNVTSINGAYDGQLIAVGTDANPIVIDGDVAINGDVVIAGVIKGSGALKVRRNSYVAGDVTYADAPGEFGVAADGTENAFALASGGSIMMGDYLTIRGKNKPGDTSKYPNSSFSIDKRTQHKSGKHNNYTVNYGYFDPGSVDAGALLPTMVNANGQTVTRQGQQFSFTTSELKLFNELELQKVMADPTYTPRLYGLREGQPDAIYTYVSPSFDEHAVRYDENNGNNVKNITTFLAENNLPLSIYENATKQYLNPQGDWISEDTLRQIWWNDEMSRPSSGRPFQFDGLLYTNNSIFSIAASKARHKSYQYGEMILRGGIVAADLGMLVPGNGNAGLTLLYDKRVQRFLRVEDTTKVSFARTVFNYENVGSQTPEGGTPIAGGQ